MSEFNNDTISRQTAIDAIEILLEQSEYDEHDKTWNDAIRGSINAIKHHVPSAQPEIIRCEDCKHRPEATRADEGITWGFSVVFPDCQCPCQCEDGWYGWYPEDDFYCGRAERREE